MLATRRKEHRREKNLSLENHAYEGPTKLVLAERKAVPFRAVISLLQLFEA